MSDVEERVPASAGDPGERVPLGQRLFDRPFLLLGAGLAVMFVFYTIWGVVEILTMSQGSLP